MTGAADEGQLLVGVGSLQGLHLSQEVGLPHVNGPGPRGNARLGPFGRRAHVNEHDLARFQPLLHLGRRHQLFGPGRTGGKQQEDKGKTTHFPLHGICRHITQP